MMRRISESELKAMFREEDRREQGSAIVDKYGEPFNARKKKGASRTVTEAVILSKIYRDGVITVGEDGLYTIDYSRVLDYPGGVATHSNIYNLLYRVESGLRAMGHEVSTSGKLSDAGDREAGEGV